MFKPGELSAQEAADLNRLLQRVTRLENLRVTGNATMISGPNNIAIEIPGNNGIGVYSADLNQGDTPSNEAYITDILQTATLNKTWFFNVNVTATAQSSYDPSLDANYLLNNFSLTSAYYLAVRSRNSASAPNLATDPLVVGAQEWGLYAKQWMLIYGSGGDYYQIAGGSYPAIGDVERGSLCGVFNNGSIDTTLYLTGGYIANIFGAATPPSPVPFTISAGSLNTLVFETSGYEYFNVPFTPAIPTGYDPI